MVLRLRSMDRLCKNHQGLLKMMDFLNCNLNSGAQAHVFQSYPSNTDTTSLHLCLFSHPRDAATKSHKPGCFKQHTFILSQFWRPKIQNQGVGRDMILPEALRKSPFLTSSSFWWPRCSLAVAASLQPLPPSPHGFLLFLCVSTLCVFYEDTCH